MPTLMNQEMRTPQEIRDHLNRLAQALRLQAHITPLQAALELEKVASRIVLDTSPSRTPKSPLAYSESGYIPTVEQLGKLRDLLPRGGWRHAPPRAQRKFLWGEVGREPDIPELMHRAPEQGEVLMTAFNQEESLRLEWVWQGRVIV